MQKDLWVEYHIYVWWLYRDYIALVKDDFMSVEWYWQVKSEERGGKIAPLSICPPQIQINLDIFRTKASKVKTGN